MRAYISSLDSANLFVENTPTNFRVQLPYALEGSWACGVDYCILPGKPLRPSYVVGDFVESSILGGRLQPVLCMTNIKTKIFTTIQHVGVKSEQVTTLHIKLVNKKGDEVILTGKETLIGLDFQKQQCRPSANGSRTLKK